MNKRIQAGLCVALYMVLQSAWLSAMPSLALSGGRQDVPGVSDSADSHLQSTEKPQLIVQSLRAIDSKLSPAAAEVATLMGVLPQLNRLRELRESSNRAPGELPGDKQLGLEMFLLERILGATLEIRTVADRIDAELAYAYDVRAILTSKRDKNLNWDFIANFTESGTLASIAGGLFLTHHPLSANLCLLSASGTGLLLSALAVKLQKGGKRKDDSSTNMLAQFLDLNPPKEHTYPILIWNYLNSTPSGKSETRRQATLRHWRESKRIDLTKEQSLYHLASLAKDEQHYDTIGLLTNRIFMLHYVHADVEQHDGSLLELLHATEMY